MDSQLRHRKQPYILTDNMEDRWRDSNAPHGPPGPGRDYPEPPPPPPYPGRPKDYQDPKPGDRSSIVTQNYDPNAPNYAEPDVETESFSDVEDSIEDDIESDDGAPKEPSMLRVVINHCLTNGGLMIGLVAYTCMGAAVFQAIEGPPEEAEAKLERQMRLDERNIFLLNISEIADMADVDEAYWRNQTEQYLRRYEEVLGVIVAESVFEPSWNFYSSVFFATTILTTIGYGNIAPVTVGGRVFCMVYAVFGIALLLLVLASIGTLLARGATIAYRQLHAWIKNRRSNDKTDQVTYSPDRRSQDIRNELYTPSGEQKNGDSDAHVVDIHGDGKKGDRHSAVSEASTAKKRESQLTERSQRSQRSQRTEVEEEEAKEVQIPLTFVLVFAFLYICFLALLLNAWEGDQWDYFEAFYFSFITLTTIGFGDLVPRHQKNLLACTFFILLGMAIMSMCIALAQEMIIEKVAWLSKKIGVACAGRKERSKQSEAEEVS